jgi:DNA helicase-2/ATP-dependent DNA helicase PcrA
LSFYYEYVLRLPSNPSKEAAYGIALHNVLKRLFDQAQKNSPKALPDDAQALEYFHQVMERSRNFFHPMIYRQYLEQGVMHLTQYLHQRRQAWDEQLQKQEIFSEKSLRQLDIEGVPVVGVIDKLILYNDPQRGYYWKVVDYKTGKADDQRLDAPTDKQPQGGFYYRQLLFYKLLVEQSPLFNRYPVKMVEIDYLFPNKQGIFEHKELSVNSEDSHWMRRLIKETYQKIRQQEFKQGCGKPYCKWCQLAKRQVQVDSFRNEIAEAMDDV